ncbi:MAG TPA: hypothetical protein VI278_10895 [Nitrososphaeraceae archaeon]
MLTKISMLIKILSISIAVLLLFTITSTYTSRFVIYPVSAQMNNNNNSSSNSNNNNTTKSTMDLAMSELARIHLMAANEALMKGNTTAAFSQMNLAYLQLSMLGMKDMGRMNETQMMKFMQSGAEQSSSPSSSSSASKMMVPENCIIIQGGVLQCRDILTGSYSLAK